MKKENQEKVIAILDCGRYSVDADNGNLYWKKSNGEVKLYRAGRIKGGACQVTLKNMVKVYLHDLIWLSFHGCFKGRIRHKDGDKGNNRLDNLWLDSDVEIPKYERREIGEKEYEEIKRIVDTGEKISGPAIARKLGLHAGAVYRMIRKIKQLKNIDL